MARGATTTRTREDWREDLTTTARVVVVVDVVVENADMIDRLVDVNGAVDDEKKVVCRVCSSEDHAVRAHVDDCRRAAYVVVAIIVRGGIADAHDSDIRRSGKYTSVMGFCFLKYSSLLTDAATSILSISRASYDDDDDDEDDEDDEEDTMSTAAARALAASVDAAMGGTSPASIITRD